MVWVPRVAKQCRFCQLVDRQNEEHSHRPRSRSQQRCPQQVLGLHEVPRWLLQTMLSHPPSQAARADFRETLRSLGHNLSYLRTESYRQSVDTPKSGEEAHAWLCFGEYFGSWGAFLVNGEAWYWSCLYLATEVPGPLGSTAVCQWTVLGEEVYHRQQGHLNGGILEQAEGWYWGADSSSWALPSLSKETLLAPAKLCRAPGLGAGTAHRDKTGAEGPPRLTEKPRAQPPLGK